MNAWRKSSLSGVNACVETMVADGMVLVRDSLDPAGPILYFDLGAWAAFLAGVRNNEFDLPIQYNSEKTPAGAVTPPGHGQS